jgi:predicted AAA+ superfamily ATPase
VDHLTRHVTERVHEALDDTRIVVVQGARQVGKTTLVREVVTARDGLLVSLDDDLTRAAAATDPAGFLAQAPSRTLAIDEVQRVPAMILALKLAADRDPRPGRFLLTGSADLLRLPAMHDSLAGRAENVDLHGFSQGELDGHRERFVDRLLSGDTFAGHGSELHRHDYLVRACAGGYPEALGRPAGRRRSAWYDNYVRRIVERDAADLSSLRRLGELPTLLRLLAARNAEELNISGIASDAGIPVRTLDPYLGLLETLFLMHRIPAWSTNLSKRVVSRPKAALLDTGLAAHLLNVSAEGAGIDGNPDLAGKVLEGFVIGEVRRNLGWSEENPRMWHYRDHDGAEVDLVLETDDGRVAGIEIKATATVTAEDTRWLQQMRERLGRRFVAGVVLHTGPTSAAFGDRIAAVPMDALWTT